MGIGKRSVRARQLLLVCVVLAGSAACGGSSDEDPSASTGGTPEPSATVASSAAPTASASPAASELPTTLDKAKFCKAIDEAAVEAAMGVPIATRSTKGRNPDNLYCIYEDRTKAGGVTVAWQTKPTNPVRETRKIAKSDPAQKEAGCAFADIATVDPALAYQASCDGYKETGKFFPQREEFYFQIGDTVLYCQIFGPPNKTLAVDAAGAASLCQGVVTSLA